MKIAYIILAHKMPEQLVRLVRKLNTAGTYFFIHVDKKTGNETYRKVIEPLRENKNILFLDRHVCNWGDFGHVEATLDGINKILQMGIEFDYVMLLTGQDYPIKSNKFIQDFLEENSESSFIEYFQLPSERWKNEGGGMDRLTYLHFNWQGRRLGFLKREGVIPRFINYFVLSTVELLGLRPKLPQGQIYFGGSSYWCLTRECIEYIGEFIKHNAGFVRYFKQALASDEIFFQTILLNSPFKDRIVNNNLRYILWSTSSHPLILTRRHFDELISSDDLFARKFDITVDYEILDMLDLAVV